MALEFWRKVLAASPAKQPTHTLDMSHGESARASVAEQPGAPAGEEPSEALARKIKDVCDKCKSCGYKIIDLDLDAVAKLLATEFAAAVREAKLEEARWWAKYHGKDYNGEGSKRIAALEREGGRT